MTAALKHNADGTCVKASEVGEAESEAVSPNFAPADANLARITAAWPTLPAGVKAVIVTMACTGQNNEP